MTQRNLARLPINSMEQLARETDQLRWRLATVTGIGGQPVQVVGDCSSNDGIDEQKVRGLIKLRRARNLFFGDFFADPAWDLLLELYACELAQRRISIGALCEAAAVPATTSLRWLNALEQAGFIERSMDWTDSRRYFVALSAGGLDAMRSFFRLLPNGEII